MAIRQEGNTYYGLSTDTKPTGAVLNGREFREMDTGKKYLFDEENGEWLEQPEEGGGGGGGSSTLSGLTDVDISNPSDGQTLVYNATSGKWENGAGGGGVLVVHEDGSTAQLDKTWQEIDDAMTAGKPVFISTPMVDGSGMGLVVATGIDQGDYLLYVINIFAPGVEQTMKYNANSSSDYPVGPD